MIFFLGGYWFEAANEDVSCGINDMSWRNIGQKYLVGFLIPQMFIDILFKYG